MSLTVRAAREGGSYATRTKGLRNEHGTHRER